MNKPVSSEEFDEKPLDPALVAVQAKLKRLLMTSSLIMLLGLGAVLSVIVYRVFLRDATPSATIAFDRPLTQAIAMPEGGRVVSTALNGDHALVTIETGSLTSQYLIDLKTLQVVRRLDWTR
jgi:hypothetical protein